MNKDWVVWGGCLMLFCAGAVWAAVPIPTDFFVVDNVHDLFEIIAAVATAGALVLAASSINTWRAQLSAATDHEHAKKALVALFKYRDDMKAARSPMLLAHELEPDGDEPQSALPGFADHLRGYRRRLDRVGASRAVLYGELSECEVLWGDELKRMLLDIYKFESEFTEYVRYYFLANGGIPNGGDGEAFRNILNKKRDVLYGWDDDFEVELRAAISNMEAYLRGKLVKR